MTLIRNGTQRFSRLDAKRREQTPQALARLVVVTLFVALWFVLWVARIPMPLPFLFALLAEILFFLVYWRAVSFLPTVRAVNAAQYVMLGAEILFHTTMVYFLGTLSWLGAFAYVFGLIFTNAFLDLRRGMIYTAGACAAFSSLILLEASGAIPHYVYLEQGPLRYTDPQFVATTLVGAVGVFVSIYLWSSWVGHQLRRERDAAVRAQDDLLHARVQLLSMNEELEVRVHARTAELQTANAALSESQQQLRLVLETCPDLISIQEPDARYRFVNSAFTTVLGYTPEQLIGLNPTELVHPDDLAEVGERFSTMVSSRLPAEATFRFRHADGHWVTLEANGQVLVDQAGQVTGVVVAHRDVTERKRAEAALRASEKRSRWLIESAPDAMVIASGAGDILMVNSETEKLFGYRRDELLGKSVELLVPERLREAHAAHRAGYLATGERRTMGANRDGLVGRRKDRSEFPVEISLSPLETDEGMLVTATVRDITERKLAEQALRESEKRLRTLIEDVDAIVWEADASTWQFSFVSRQAETILGYPAERWSTEPDFWINHVHPDDREWAVAFCMKATDEGRDHEFNYRMVAKDGRIIWLHDIVRVISDSEGKAERLRGVMIDITERKLAEDALRESEERYRSLAENSFDLICEASADARFSYLSSNYNEALGYAPEELLGTTIFDLIHPDDRPAVASEFARALSTRTTGQAVFRFRHKDGEWVWFESVGRAFEAKSGELRAVIISRDVTERKRAEEAIRESEETLKATIESTADGILVVHPERRVAYVNRRFIEMWHLPEELADAGGDSNDIVTYVLDQVEDPNEFVTTIDEIRQTPGEWRDTLRCKDGRVIERYARALLKDGQIVGRVVSCRDVTERMRAEEALNEQARRDPLTGLLNRRAGLTAVAERLAHAKGARGRLAILILDLDRFKLINDRYGHETGDAALTRFADVMTDLAGAGGVLCRLGGDEFEIALDGADLKAAVRFAERLRQALRRSLNQPNVERLPPFTVSTGVACYPEDGASDDDLARRADEAMYAAKAGGADAVCAWRELGNRQVA